jgi:hypothetical protein
MRQIVHGRAAVGRLRSTVAPGAKVSKARRERQVSRIGATLFHHLRIGQDDRNADLHSGLSCVCLLKYVVRRVGGNRARRLPGRHRDFETRDWTGVDRSPAA